MLVKQQAAKTARDIFMGIRFVAVIPKTQNKQIAVLEDKDTTIKNLEQRLNNYRRKLSIYAMGLLLNDDNHRKKHSQHSDTFNYPITICQSKLQLTSKLNLLKAWK
jgi:hypothetical protein